MLMIIFHDRFTSQEKDDDDDRIDDAGGDAK